LRFDIYDQGLRMEAYFTADPIVDQALCSAITIFNIGLVHHIAGQQHNICRQHEFLQKSLRLYETSLQLLQRLGVRSSTENAVVDLLNMALLNNMAQIHFELSSFESSQILFEHLVRFSSSTTMATYSDEQVKTRMNLQRQFFLLNAPILQAPGAAPAA
jgi:hypothetical protein